MAQKYEKAVQEDLNVGTGTVWVKAPGGGEILATQVGLHSFARGLAPSASLTGVIWTSEVNMTASSYRVTKSAATSAFDAGAISAQQLTVGDGTAEFKTEAVLGSIIFGLGTGNTGQGAADVEFGIYITGGTGDINVIEGGAVVAPNAGTYVAGDSLYVVVTGGSVLYYHEQTLLYTSLVAPTYPLVVDCSAFYQNSWVEAWVTGFGSDGFTDQASHSATWAPGSIAAGSKASTTVAVAEATTGDLVLASHDKILTSDLRISGHVSAAGTAKVVIHNPTSAAVTVASGTVSVLVFPAIGTAAPETNGSISGTVYLAVEEGGNEEQGVTVAITAQGLSTVSSVTGTFSFPSVAPGAVTLDGTKAGGITGTANGTAIAGQNVVINLVVTAPI